MKIAIVSIKKALLDSGAEVRNYYLLRGLKEKYSVSYYTPILPKQLPTENFLKRLSEILRGRIPYIEYLRQGVIDSKTLKEIKKADVIHLEELESFFAIEKYLADLQKPVVLDAHNVEYKRFLSDLESQNFINKIVGKVLANKIKEIEIKALKKINYIITCSQVDEIFFTKHFNPKKIIYIPNGVDCDLIKPKNIKTENNILFMGLLSYGPNEDGLRFYLEKIHGLVKAAVPNSVITVIGKSAPKWLVSMADIDRSIKLQGFVADVREPLSKAMVCISPLRSGSGTRLKVLEYMAAGKVVVSTAKGVEGLDVIDDEEVLIADSADEFANKLIKVLKNKSLAERIGSKARIYVQNNHDWKSITDKLNKFYLKNFT